jgi:SAM-dependent methyltransferase
VSSFYVPLGPAELLPRYAFLEALLPGRRVLEIGAVASTGGRSAAFLRSRGARRVLAFDESADAVAAARREYASDPELRFASGAVDDLPDERFDLVLVADATPLVRVPSRLDRAARSAAEDGWLVLGLRNPAGASLSALVADEPAEAPPTFGELRAALQARFPSVEAVTQSAFVGYRLAPMAGGELETAVDGTLVDPEECAYYLAVAGQRPCGVLGAEAIVALRAAPLVVGAGRRHELAERLRLAEVELQRLRALARDGGKPGS